MAYTPSDLSSAALQFLTEYHLGSLTTMRGNGLPHVVAVGFTWDGADGLARVITGTTSQKAVNVRRTGYATVFQVERARWLALEGPAVVVDDSDRVAAAVDRYTRRYRTPRVNPTRVAIEIRVERILGSRSLFDESAIGS